MRTYRHLIDGVGSGLAAESGGAYDLGDHGDRDGTDGAAGSPLDGLAAAAEGFHAELGRILDGVLEARVWGGTLAATGMGLEEWLGQVCRLPGWLVAQVASVAERLPALPHVTAAYRDRVLRFDDLATFVDTTRELHGELLARLDAEAASLARRHDHDHLSLAEWAWQVDQLVADLRAPAGRSRVDRRRTDPGWTSTTRIQGDLDGGGRVVADLAPLDFAQVVSGLERDTGPPSPEVARGQQRAATLVRWARQALGGDTAHGTREAQPAVVVTVDLATATSDRFGRLLATATGNGTAWLDAALVETLAVHGELLVQLTDGHDPLAELAASTADIPAAVRRAVAWGHRRCAWPGCPAPILFCDLHHLTPRAEGGGHQPANLAPLCRVHHGRVQRHRWDAVKDPSTGRITWTHRASGTQIASLPEGTRPAPWDRMPHLHGLAPPIPPVPPDQPPDPHTHEPPVDDDRPAGLDALLRSRPPPWPD